MDDIIRQWSTFLDNCLTRRISADRFAAAAAQLHAKSPLPGPKIATLLLRPRSANVSGYDVHTVDYSERLLALKKLDTSDILASAFRYSKDWLPRPGDKSPVKDAPWNNPPGLDEVIFHRLSKSFQAEERPLDSNEGFGTLLVMTRWMQAMVTSHTNDNMIKAITGMQTGIQHQPQQQSINVHEGLGVLVIGVVENPKMIRILNHPKCVALRKAFAKSLASFIAFLSHGSNASPNSLQIASRLELSQKQQAFYEKPVAIDGEVTRDTSLDVAALQLEAVLDLPTVNTRAGLYILFNALLVARPLTDDYTIINILHARYKMDGQSKVTDLITAAFDVLANAMYRSEPSQTMFGFKSFLINKVPVLLSQISAAVFPISVELCITQVISHLDPNAFPAFSQGFDELLGNSNSLADVRQDFLNACALHGLIQTATVERLLGEAPVQGPPETKYDKKTLLEQCKNNFEKVSVYIDELDNLDGNAGAIVGTIAEFIAYLCETQMTMYLKQLSIMIFRKPQAMDVILQFASPASILQPLCQCLDDWHYDSDQGEYQPIYDEFGAVLVLVMTFVYRYHLTRYDIGIDAGTFVARMIATGHQSVPQDDLTTDQSKHLGDWLIGLLNSGNEGLSNDVFASCRPQDFYLIVPTLFCQLVTVLSNDLVPFDTIKGALEYLGETVLLPSLIGGLSWMASHALLQTHNDLDALMQIFHVIILSEHSSGDAQAMHAAILAMVSSRLDKCFRTLRSRNADRGNKIEPMLQAIKEHRHYDRSMYASVKELEQWTNPPNSTLDHSLRNTVQQLTLWTSVGMQPNPPSYTHRQVYTSQNMLGAHKTLRALVSEIKIQTEAGNGAAALDIGVSIICAPTIEDSPMSVTWGGSTMLAPQPSRTRANLREMLKEDFDNAASLVATDPSTAETLVRLHRRVEAQLESATSTTLQGEVSTLMPDVNLAGMSSQAIPNDMHTAISEAAAASIANDITTMDNKALQRSMEELGTEGLDLSNIDMGTGDAGATGMGPELGDIDLSDIGGMNMDMDMDGLDMTMGGGGDDDWGLDFENM